MAEFAESTQLVASVRSAPGAVHDFRVIEVGKRLGEAGQGGDGDWDWLHSSRPGSALDVQLATQTISELSNLPSHTNTIARLGEQIQRIAL